MLVVSRRTVVQRYTGIVLESPLRSILDIVLCSDHFRDSASIPLDTETIDLPINAWFGLDQC